MSTGISESPDSRYWRQMYRAALFEVEGSKLPARIAEAENSLYPNHFRIVVLIAGKDWRLEAVAELVAAGTPRRVAADVVSRLTGAPRNVLYRRTL